MSVGIFAHYEPESRAAEARKDVTELGFFRRSLTVAKRGKSHSCEFFQLQVSLAENSRQQRTSKPLFHTVFQANSSLYALGFKIEFVKLSVIQKKGKQILVFNCSNAQHFEDENDFKGDSVARFCTATS